MLAIKTSLTNTWVMRRPIATALLLASLAGSAQAVRELVIVQDPQIARQVEGIVIGPGGNPLDGMTVTDRTMDGQSILRTTKTDSRGHFKFSSQSGKTDYCLRFDGPLYNPLQLTLRLDKHAPNRGVIAKPNIGG